MNKLDQLKSMTTVVADTGDIDSIAQYQPQDATTNPSLLYKAIQSEAYVPHIEDALDYAKRLRGNEEKQLLAAQDRLAVNVGIDILSKVPGRVSTEVDARLSFDAKATIARARHLITLYDAKGIDRERVLIKIAATWEGIQAAKLLEQQGIHCNLTLMFHFSQAVACAEAGVTLISPFVGRIYDWYKAKEGRDLTPDEDPGVHSVRDIFNYYRHFDIPTIVMGASFRTAGQIEALSGCDYLTISPQLLETLAQDEAPLTQALSVSDAKAQTVERVTFDESGFRWALNGSPMATEKLAHGISAFAKDLVSLEAILRERLAH